MRRVKEIFISAVLTLFLAYLTVSPFQIAYAGGDGHGGGSLECIDRVSVFENALSFNSFNSKDPLFISFKQSKVDLMAFINLNYKQLVSNESFKFFSEQPFSIPTKEFLKNLGIRSYDLYQAEFIPQVDSSGESVTLELHEANEFKGYSEYLSAIDSFFKSLDYSKSAESIIKELGSSHAAETHKEYHQYKATKKQLKNNIVDSVLQKVRVHSVLLESYVRIALKELRSDNSGKKHKFITNVVPLQNQDFPMPNNVNNLFTPSNCGDNPYKGIVSWNTDTIFIDSTRYEMLSPLDQAALELHEAFYKVYRMDQSIAYFNSNRTQKTSYDSIRLLIGALFSKNIILSNGSKQKIDANLIEYRLNIFETMQKTNLDFLSLPTRELIDGNSFRQLNDIACITDNIGIFISLEENDSGLSAYPVMQGTLNGQSISVNDGGSIHVDHLNAEIWGTRQYIKEEKAAAWDTDQYETPLGISEDYLLAYDENYFQHSEIKLDLKFTKEQLEKQIGPLNRNFSPKVTVKIKSYSCGETYSLHYEKLHGDYLNTKMGKSSLSLIVRAPQK